MINFQDFDKINKNKLLIFDRLICLEKWILTDDPFLFCARYCPRLESGRLLWEEFWRLLWEEFWMLLWENECLCEKFAQRNLINYIYSADAQSMLDFLYYKIYKKSNCLYHNTSWFYHQDQVYEGIVFLHLLYCFGFWSCYQDNQIFMSSNLS